MKDYQAYLLDFDGTLFDTYVSLTYIYRYAFAKIYYDCTPEQTAVFMHMSVMETCDRLGILDSKKREIVREAIAESLDFSENLALIKPYDDVRETLDELRRRGKSAVLFRVIPKNILPWL